MKKLLLALPLVAGASWAGSTYFSGAQTEAAYTRLLEQINNKAQGVFVLKSTEYNGGIMESTAITEVRSADSSGEEIHFLLNHKINHSLVSVAPENPRFGAASIVTTLLVDDSYSDDAKKFMSAFESGEPFIATTEVGVDGATSSEIKFNAIDYSIDDSAVKSSGTLINVATTANGSVTGDGTTNDFMFSEGADKKADLSNLTTKFNLNRLESDGVNSKFFHDVNFELKMDETKIVDGGQQVALLQDLSYVLKQNLSTDEPAVDVQAGVDSMQIAGVPLESVDFGLGLSGFSLTEIMSNQAFFEEFKNVDNPAEYFLSEKGLQILRATLKPNTKMAVKLDATSAEGDGNAAVDLWFAGNGSADGYTGMATTGDLAKSIAGRAIGEIDKSALMNTPVSGMLEHPMAQAYLTVTEDKVKLNANLDKLVLKLNEQVIPLEMMAGGMLNLPLDSLLQQF